MSGLQQFSLQGVVSEFFCMDHQKHLFRMQIQQLPQGIQGNALQIFREADSFCFQDVHGSAVHNSLHNVLRSLFVCQNKEIFFCVQFNRLQKRDFICKSESFRTDGAFQIHQQKISSVFGLDCQFLNAHGHGLLFSFMNRSSVFIHLDKGFFSAAGTS